MKFYKKKVLSLPLNLMILGAFILIGSCKKYPKQRNLIGAWKIDSTYTYYNGFTYTQKEEGADWATYVYDKDGIMQEIKYGSFQSYHYSIKEHSDTLLLKATQGDKISELKVLGLTKERMILRKDKSPLFSGNNQKRYEIRYYSRTQPPKENLIPFKDPRKNTVN
ncbi:hypothetical protein [Pareuzebyella sediminis]|uniref:hypothetical protein n=1 Tax=Pareuzebyella sediminis TaxID=2607998 RepID=UPI0011EE7EE3|nr:hypothetical protein [Pareuzebyella sediminis]